jgi:hypothetical protein
MGATIIQFRHCYRIRASPAPGSLRVSKVSNMSVASQLKRRANLKKSMPAILTREDRAAWLSGTPDEAFAALKQYPDAHLVPPPISTRVNAPRNNDATLIQPLAA